MCKSIKGKIHSFQSLGTVDGPGVRYVVFLHGCNLHCGYCHNVDVCKGEYSEYYAQEVFDKVIRFKEYFGERGGLTVSGGEPLLQTEFLYELFNLCKQNGITTALDTSGSIFNNSVKKVLELCDYVLLDIKMSNNSDYEKYIGCNLDMVIEFLQFLDSHDINTWIRHVVIEGVNDNDESVDKFKNIINRYSCIKRVDILPFRKICKSKYDNMNIDFPFDIYPETSEKTIKKITALLYN